MIEGCRHCGKEIEESAIYCPDCRALTGVQKQKRFWVFSIIFSVLLLALTGLLLWHWDLGFWNFSPYWIFDKPAALVNGESISRAELKARVKYIGQTLERQYGKDLFTGSRGQALMDNLEKQVLEGMVEERLIAQEARRMQIQISEDKVQQEMKRISREIYGNWEDFQNRLAQDGVSSKELEKHIHSLLLFQELKAAKAIPGSDPEDNFKAWFVKAKQNAQVAIYDSGKVTRGSSSCAGGCCGPGQGSGGSALQPRGSGQVDQKTEKEAEKAALEAYRKVNPSEQGISAKVSDFGCHIQVDIQKDGRVIKSYAYQGGRVFEN